jgi:hypothetical protein
LQVKQFALLPDTAILCVLETTPWRIIESENLIFQSPTLTALTS